MADGIVSVMLGKDPRGLSLGDRAILQRRDTVRPHPSWIGRIVDAHGQPLDGRPLLKGDRACPVQNDPPPATLRRPLGQRLETGLTLFNTVLPIVAGQRIGLFAGSGVGKSTLLGRLARNVDCDVSVIALIGERGREVREFVDHSLGPRGRARSIVVATTSDQSALDKRNAGFTAMAIAEYFRDQGKRVLLVVDSVTRLAEAHREIALAGGEAASMRGYPPSLVPQLMSLAERSGPGLDGAGDITAVFPVLVAGSDMEEPVADILRGTLDGHVVLDRAIAERGRFPAVDVLRSVSRALPQAANAEENTLLAEARKLLAAYSEAELMIRAGLYEHGSDPLVDRAIKISPALDQFFSESGRDISQCFEELEGVLVGESAPNDGTTNPAR